MIISELNVSQTTELKTYFKNCYSGESSVKQLLKCIDNYFSTITTEVLNKIYHSTEILMNKKDESMRLVLTKCLGTGYNSLNDELNNLNMLFHTCFNNEQQIETM